MNWGQSVSLVILGSSTQLSYHLTPNHVQLDVALEEIETQRNGLVFIYNMTNSKYSNFDYDLSQKMLTLLKGNYVLPSCSVSARP